MSSFWDEWFKRFGRRPSIFSEIDRMMREMEREMAEAFKEMEDRMPDEMLRERRLPDGSVRREYGPFVYGYSIKIGPDGKPIIREFGNFKPGKLGEGRTTLHLQGQREPLVDVIEEDDRVMVIAELPGVEKEDVQLFATSGSLTIKVDTPDRKFYKELEFPVDVDETTGVSKYTNGILETSFKKKRERGQGRQLTIE